MQANLRHNAPTPPDCFRQEEAEQFLLFENERLETVNYFVWQASSEQGIPASGFLYALELYFENGETLLLSSGESSEAIGVITAESLVGTAQQLQEIHGEAIIQRIDANEQPLWLGAVGEVLLSIQLSRHENGLYRNDALLLDFGEKKILVRLGEKDGLELGEYE